MNFKGGRRHLPEAAIAGLAVGGLTFGLVAALAAANWGTAIGSAASPPTAATPAPATATLTSNSSHRAAQTRTAPLLLSPSWAGPVLSGGTYDQVTATFVVPQAKCSKTATDSAFWAGLDGALTTTVEQNGVDVLCVGGKAYYQPWIEEYPAPPVMLDPSQFAVAPGDTVTVTTSASGVTNTFDFIDHTTGTIYMTTATVAQGARDNTAECIAEAPTAGSTGKLVKLTNFGSVTFTQCSAQVVAPKPANCQLVTGQGCPSGSKVANINIGTRHHHSTRIKAETMATVDGGFVVTWHHS